jgi:tetratricopeptide (TPR) repeat protein
LPVHLVVHPQLLAARVLVARQEFAAALALVDGALDLAAEPGALLSSTTAGLRWLRGLLLLREGRVTPAILSFAREIDELPAEGGSFADVRVNAQVGAGFAHLAAGDPAGAIDAFRLALQTHPRHGRALVGLQSAFQRTSLAPEAHRLASEIDQAIAAENRRDEAAQVSAAALLVRGELDEACRTLHRMLVAGPPSPAGWMIPIDPALSGLRTHEGYPSLMALLRKRTRADAES